MDLKKSGIALGQQVSPLIQLLEDINFQRTKELRNLMKDESGFVVLHGNTQWTEIFVRHFLFQTHKEAAIDSDDLLFFVRKKYVKGSNRNMPKYETEIEVFRKDSKKLPIGDPEIDWEETVYLNLVIHQFDYYLTLAICTRTSPKNLQILKRHSQRVYASPSRRKMDSKGEAEEITFPQICFCIDNFDEVFHDILVRDGEMVCVELVARDKDGSTQGVIFLGSIRYDALKKVYDARQSSLSSKMAQRMTFGLFNSAPQTRCEFVRMKGPSNKGYAEMAVTKPKGSGIETPTSEPGFCMTDMYDSECDEEYDEYYNQRHQRRLSDPSSNLNNFSRNGWKTRSNQGANAKALSQNEGLDSLANEISEIEAGDVRDDRPASSLSETKLTNTRGMRRSKSVSSPPSCCTCFPSSSTQRGCGGARYSLQLSDIYSPCTEHITNSPSCLTTITTQRPPEQIKTLLNVESEIEYSKNFNKKLIIKKSTLPKIKSESESFDVEIASEAADAESVNQSTTNNKLKEEKVEVMTEKDKRDMIRVSGKEELPEKKSSIIFARKRFMREKINLENNNDDDKSDKFESNADGNNNPNDNVKYSTLPMINKSKYKRSISIPQRVTSDGTKIYYLCDLPKSIRKEIDDGMYNPLWTSKGSTQTFHFWKENRRQNSTPLNAFLTYVSLPWYSIAKDLLDHREMPILTF